MTDWILRVADRLRDLGRRRRENPMHALGRRGEDLAHRYLEGEGFRIVGRNYRTRTGSGEVDLVAWDRDTLVFVEVKSRASDQYAAPDRAIGTEKMSRLRRAASQYCRRANIGWDRVRFDTVSIVFEEPVRISHSRDAFPVR